MFLTNCDRKEITNKDLIPSKKSRRSKPPILNLDNQKLNLQNIDIVAVHFYWFVKYSVSKFIQIFTSLTQQSPDYKLFITLIKKINASADAYGNSALVHISKHFKKIIATPKPYLSENDYGKETKYNKSLRVGYISQDLTRNGGDIVKFRQQIVAMSKEYQNVIERYPEFNIHLDGIENRILDVMKTAPIFQYYLQLSFYSSIGSMSHDLSQGPLTYKLGLTTKYVTRIPLEYSLFPLELKDQLYRFNEYPIRQRDKVFVFTMRQQMLAGISEFIENSAHKYPTNFIEDSETKTHREVGFFSPNLTHHLTNILIETESNSTLKPVSIRKHENHISMLNNLHEFLWINATTIIHDRYDPILLYTDNQLNSYLLFLQALNQAITNSPACAATFMQTIENSSVYRAQIDFCVDLLRDKSYENEKTGIIMCDLLLLSRKFMEDAQMLLKSYKLNLHRLAMGLSHMVPFVTTDLLGDKLLFNSNAINIISAYCKAVVALSLPSQDPINLQITRRKYLADNCKILEQFLNVYKKHELGLHSEELFKHELYYEVEGKLNQLRTKLLTVSDATFIRPIDQNYSDLHILITNFLNSQLYESIKCMHKLHSLIDLHADGADSDRCKDVIDSVNLWLMSKRRFIQQLELFDGYPDIILPIKISIADLGFGLEILRNLLQKLIIGKQMSIVKFDLNNALVNLIQFPKYVELSDSGFNFYLWNDILGKTVTGDGQKRIQAEEGLR